MESFDVVVIGAGPAGEVAAGRLGEGGLRVALVERQLVGGECSFWACMPTKAMLRPGELLGEVARVPGAREAVTGMLDVRAALHRRDEVVHGLDDTSMLPWLEERGVTLVRGHAERVAEGRVTVDGRDLEATRAIVLATGSSALVPPIDGLREARPWTNREATTAQHVPDRLLVLGGGVAGVELAQAYATFGSAVTLIEAAERLIPREEPFASEQVAAALGERGVDVRTGAKATRVERVAGQVTLSTEDGERHAADELLVGIGRRPNSDLVADLGFEPGKPVEADVRGRTRLPWLYAIGDVNGRAQLTHMGKYQARLAADCILGRDGDVPAHGADAALSPRVIFTDPNVAAVGHTLAGAQDAGLEVRAVDVETSGNAGGSFHGRDAAGTARMVVDERARTVVGFTVTGADTSELLHAATVAVVGEVPLDRLWHAVPPFPTRSELWLRLLEAYGL